MNKPITTKEMEDWVGETWDRCQKEAWSEPMNRDDIIRMAREAGGFVSNFNDRWVMYADSLERFAALVAAAEREACAKLCDDKAKETFSGQCQVWGDYFARVIRARGEK